MSIKGKFAKISPMQIFNYAKYKSLLPESTNYF